MLTCLFSLSVSLLLDFSLLSLFFSSTLSLAHRSSSEALLKSQIPSLESILSLFLLCLQCPVEFVEQWASGGTLHRHCSCSSSLFLLRSSPRADPDENSVHTMAVGERKCSRDLLTYQLERAQVFSSHGYKIKIAVTRHITSTTVSQA